MTKRTVAFYNPRTGTRKGLRNSSSRDIRIFLEANPEYEQRDNSEFSSSMRNDPTDSLDNPAIFLSHIERHRAGSSASHADGTRASHAVEPNRAPRVPTDHTTDGMEYDYARRSKSNSPRRKKRKSSHGDRRDSSRRDREDASRRSKSHSPRSTARSGSAIGFNPDARALDYRDVQEVPEIRYDSEDQELYAYLSVGAKGNLYFNDKPWYKLLWSMK